MFLDAGHGGIDPGALGETRGGERISEAEETLPVELAAASLLRGMGFRVVVSRTRNSTVAKAGRGDIANGAMTEAFALRDVAARALCADLAKAAVLIGIYFDAGYSPANAGCLTAYDTARPFARANLALADLVQRVVISALNARGWKIPDIGVLVDSGLGSPTGSEPLAARYDHLLLLGPALPDYFSTPSEMPGVVVEPLFVTDPFEATIAASAAGQRVIADAIATAVSKDLAGRHSS